MNKYIPFLLLLLPLWVTAQPTPAPFVLYSEGSITYAPDRGRAFPVYSSTHLTGPGTLSLADGSRLEIVHQERLVRIEGPKKSRLEDLIREMPEAKGFIQRFVEFVGKGIDQSANRESLEEAYLRNQGNAQGNISGYGDGGLAGVLPFGGVLSPGPVAFTWPQREGPHKLRIADSLSETIVLEVTTQDTSFHADLGELLLEDGKTYYWEVVGIRPATTGPARLGRRSADAGLLRIYFTFSERDPSVLLADTIVSSLSQELSTDNQRQLLKSMVLEEAGYLYAADAAYREGLSDHPADPLMRRSYASFLARWNQRSRAQELINEGS